MEFNTLALELTRACPNRCKYCYGQGRVVNGNMSEEVILASLNYFKKQNEFSISLLGGEPVLRLNTFLPILEKFLQNNNNKISLSLNTNALLFNKNLCEKLKKFNPKIAISLDGPKEIHDFNRIDVYNNGTYERVVEKIPLILDYFPDAFCQATFTPDTIYGLSDSYFLAKDLGFKEWYWAPDLYNSEWKEIHFLELEKQMKIISNDYFQQNKILYKPFERLEDRNKGNLRFKKDTHCLLVAPDGLSKISRVNATIIDIESDKEWYIGNILNGLDKEKIENWINKYGEEADRLYYAFNTRSECSQCLANNICYNTEHSLENIYLYKIQCQQPRIQCEQKKAIMKALI